LDAATWQAFYASDLQGVYAPLVVPILFLLYRAVRGRPAGGRLSAAAGFVDRYAIVFALETIVDPIATGPLARLLGIAEGVGGTALMLLFVLLGDFRVYLLVFAVIAIAAGRRWTSAVGGAAAWTFVVPIAAYGIDAGLRTVVARPDPNSIWLVYELLFVGVALALRARLVPARVSPAQPAVRAFLRAALLYAALYYGLWALADALIQIGGSDVGWLLRIVPNQLYYALWVPAVYFAFFSER
jgi:hypothetical protein